MKRHTLAAPVVALFLISALHASSASASPKIGDEAPAINVAKWITEAPAVLPGDKGADKHVFLIEFWATWVPQCEKSIPHMAELQDKHKAAGLIVIGISNEEPDTIQGFIDQKLKMPYCVGSDDEMKTSTAWVDDIQTIPHAFLIDKTGTVVWSGSSDADAAIMDVVIKDVLAEKYDLEAAKNAAATERKFKELEVDRQAAYAARDKDKLFKAVDAMIALRPRNLSVYLSKRYFLREFGREDEVPALETIIEATFVDSIEDLRFLVTTEWAAPLASRSPGLMLRCAERVNKLGKGRDPKSLTALARIQCELGLVSAAVLSQSEALSLASDDEVEEYKKVLAYFLAVKKLAKEHRGGPTSKRKDKS
jgi:thiol-disulfide isomerase/thioredoxin